jgi:hypothetical protein
LCFAEYVVNDLICRGIIRYVAAVSTRLSDGSPFPALSQLHVKMSHPVQRYSTAAAELLGFTQTAPAITKLGRVLKKHGHWTDRFPLDFSLILERDVGDIEHGDCRLMVFGPLASPQS